MSCNLLEGLTPNLRYGASATDDGYQLVAYGGPSIHQDQAIWYLADQSAVESNQTMTASFALMGGAAMANAANVSIGYKDGAGNLNWYGASVDVATGWEHAFATLAVPAGMTPASFYISPNNGAPAMQVANVSLRYGERLTLASACHTPYVTQVHADAVFATKASLTVQADRITSEVAARATTDSNVSELSTKVTQTDTSITSLIKGDSTYTAPDGTTADNPLAQTANSAKSTADITATMVREYSDGVLVCKTGNAVGALVNADGSFQVVKVAWNGSAPTVGDVLTNIDADSVDLAIGQASSAITMCGGHGRVRYLDSSGQLAIQGSKGAVLSYDPGTGVFPDIGIGVTADSAGNYRIYGAGEFDLAGNQTVQGNLTVTGDITEGGRTVLTPNVLYSASSPNLYSVSLSDSVANYRLVTLQYRDTDGYDGTATVGDGVKVGSPNGIKAFCSTAGLTSDAAYVKCKTYLVSGETVDSYKSSVYQTCQFSVTNNSCNYENADYIGIVGVIGWK